MQNVTSSRSIFSQLKSLFKLFNFSKLSNDKPVDGKTHRNSFGSRFHLIRTLIIEGCVSQLASGRQAQTDCSFFGTRQAAEVSLPLPGIANRCPVASRLLWWAPETQLAQLAQLALARSPRPVSFTITNLIMKQPGALDNQINFFFFFFFYNL